jgi:hypothetical protein
MQAVPMFLADDDPFGIVIACFFLLVLVVGGAYAVLWLRKRLWATPEDEAVSGVGFTLGDLRQLHKSGQISEEEFAKAKEKIVAAARRAAERDAAPPKAGPQNPQAGGQ